MQSKFKPHLGEKTLLKTFLGKEESSGNQRFLLFLQWFFYVHSQNKF